MQNPDPQRRLRLHGPARRRILREVLEQFWQIAQSMPERNRHIFGLWQAKKNFRICAWAAHGADRFQAVGDPFVLK